MVRGTHPCAIVICSPPSTVISWLCPNAPSGLPSFPKGAILISYLGARAVPAFFIWAATSPSFSRNPSAFLRLGDRFMKSARSESFKPAASCSWTKLPNALLTAALAASDSGLLNPFLTSPSTFHHAFRVSISTFCGTSVIFGEWAGRCGDPAAGSPDAAPPAPGVLAC